MGIVNIGLIAGRIGTTLMNASLEFGAYLLNCWNTLRDSFTTAWPARASAMV
jgi:hypothetical protein